MRCGRFSFGAVAADGAAEPWPAIEFSALADTVTGGAPLQPTRFKIGWNPAELRVLFHASDAAPNATMTRRDAPLYEEEVVEVFLDTVGDLGGYYEIEVNPLNAVLDLVLRRNRSGYRKNFAWRCEGLVTAVRIDPGISWTSELSIPMSSIVSEPPKPGDIWRANFYRIDRPVDGPVEYSAWSATGRPQFHVPARFGAIEFGE